MTKTPKIFKKFPSAVDALVKAMNETCLHCGSLKQLCECKEFENVWGEKSQQSRRK